MKIFRQRIIKDNYEEENQHSKAINTVEDIKMQLNTAEVFSVTTRMQHQKTRFQNAHKMSTRVYNKQHFQNRKDEDDPYNQTEKESLTLIIGPLENTRKQRNISVAGD